MFFCFDFVVYFFSYPSMSHPFYQMSDELNQQLPYPPGLDPNNFMLPSTATSFLHSLRNNPRKVEPEHPGNFPFGGGPTQHQLNNQQLFPSGMSFLERMRLSQMENAFAPSNYPSSSNFLNEHQNSDRMNAAHTSSSMFGAHQINDPYSTGSMANALFERTYNEPAFHGDISRNEHNQHPPQGNDWREEFKALLGPSFGNVNIKFSSDMGKFLIVFCCETFSF